MVGALRVGVVSALLLPLLAGAGCGGGGSTIGLDELWGRLITALCKFEAACGEMPDVAACLASQRQEASDGAALKADIASGKVRYDGVKARTCIEAFERFYAAPAPCRRSEQVALGTEDAEACAGVFAGTVPAGAACVDSVECAGGGSCEQTDPACSSAQQCCAGTCLAKPAPIPVGGACAAAFDQTCVDGAFCYMETATSPLTCLVPSKVEGTACTSLYLCASPLFCDLDPATGTGTCRRAAATGAPCDTSVSYGSCDDLRDYCDDATATCKSRVAPGGTCDPLQSYNCVGYATCEGTTCVARPQAGEACNPTGSPACLGSLQCAAQTNTCTLAPLPPDPCL